MATVDKDIKIFLKFLEREVKKMRKIGFLVLLLMVGFLFIGCGTMTESIRNVKTVYGYSGNKIKVDVDKQVYYKLAYHQFKLGSKGIGEKVETNPSEKQKKCAAYFIEAVKQEFEKKGLALVENNERAMIEIRILYIPAITYITTSLARTQWVITGGIEIVRDVYENIGLSDDKTIKELAERLAKKTCQDFFELI